MHVTKHLSLLLVMAMSALAVPAVVADQPAIPQPSPLPPSQPVTYRYSDAQGFGTITLTDVGADTATGGRQLLVSITQNGVQYSGSGLTYPLPNEPRPLNNLITFTVLAPGGTAYFYQGKMGLGVEFQGSGTYHPVTDPTQSATWGLLFAPGVTPPPPVPPPALPLNLSVDRGCGSGYSIGGPIVITYGARVNDTLTLVDQRNDGTPPLVLFANQPVIAGQTYAISTVVSTQPGPRTLVLMDSSGAQVTCSLTGVNNL